MDKPIDLTAYGRKVELVLFGSTSFFHICTCYVKNAAARKQIRKAKLSGMSDAEIVKQFGQWISAEAPILRYK